MCCALMTARCVVTQAHVERTAIYADGMAEVMGLDWGRRRALRIGALLHDLGKIGVPDHILQKQGKLTPAEFEVMKIHPGLGAEILSGYRFGCPVPDAVRWHHEQWAGGGYPDGLKGEEIPLTARILSVVDVFDAVREERVYRKAMTRAAAIEVLRAGVGTMFDPVVVRAFIQNLHRFEREIERQQFTHTQLVVPPLSQSALRAAPAAGYAEEGLSTPRPA